MKHLLILLLFFSLSVSHAQNYVDTIYTIKTDAGITYGSSENFAGKMVELKMDISYPDNDPLQACGRPLAIIIHGGAFTTGSKNEMSVVLMRNDFAKRGYVAAAINYRLGYFQSSTSKNCNLPNWNCLNLADSAEWYRAAYRGIQDAKGALRFLINNKDQFKIDPSNIFVFGESAGAFISLGVAFMDVEDEKPSNAGEINAVSAPHADYHTSCIQNSSYSLPISEMRLTRPDLGSVEGDLNPTLEPYRIRGVGVLFGGTISEFFTHYKEVETPGIYIFHQPNDLIVPYNRGRIYEGMNNCAINSAGCANIAGRPFIYGGNAIKNLLDTISIPLEFKPNYLFETSNNNATCVEQVLNPATGGHQYDNFRLRQKNMASYFSTKIDQDDCGIVSYTRHGKQERKIRIFPNPATDLISISHIGQNAEVTIMNMLGNIVNPAYTLYEHDQLDISGLAEGLYMVKISLKDKEELILLRKCNN